MGRVFRFLGGHATYVLFIGVFLGLLLPQLAALARPLLAPCVFILLTATLLRVEWAAVLGYMRRPLLTILLLFWLLAATPILTAGLLALLPLPSSLTAAIVLMASAPPIIGATAIAIILGLDGALTLISALLATLLAPLTVPPMALWLLGLELEIGILEFMARLAVLVVGAILIAVVVRRLLGARRVREAAVQIDGLVVTVMLVFAVAIMDGVTARLIAEPLLVLGWLAASAVANPLLQVLGVLVFFWLGRRAALTVGLFSGNRNMGLLLAALPAGVDFDVVLYFAIAQIPMYVLPALTAPIYRRLLAGQVPDDTQD